MYLCPLPLPTAIRTIIYWHALISNPNMLNSLLLWLFPIFLFSLLVFSTISSSFFFSQHVQTDSVYSLFFSSSRLCLLLRNFLFVPDSNRPSHIVHLIFVSAIFIFIPLCKMHKMQNQVVIPPGKVEDHSSSRHGHRRCRTKWINHSERERPSLFTPLPLVYYP